MKSKKYGREACEFLSHYYEAIQVIVTKSGFYVLSSDSAINIYGYLYKDFFNPSNPFENYLSRNDQGCDNNQFKLAVSLRTNTTYVLVVTTYYSEMIGKFLIFGAGPDNMVFKPIGECLRFTNNQHRSRE